MTSLTIVVPTLNRPKAVIANIGFLVDSIIQSNIDLIDIEILLSENGPDAGKEVDKDKIALLKQKFAEIGGKLTHRKINTRHGLGEHMNRLFLEIDTKWQIWLGDDDLMDPSYLSSLLSMICDEKFGNDAVFSKCVPITEQQFFQRVTEYKSTRSCLSNKDFSSCTTNTLKTIKGRTGEAERLTIRGTQLSGLLFRTSVVKTCHASMAADNLYPWVTLMGESLAAGGVIEFKMTGVFVTSDTPKLFTYGKDGLQGELAEAILSIPSLRQNEKYKFCRLCLSNLICFWRMHLTSKTILGQIIQTLKLLSHPKIPLRVAIISVPLAIIKMIKTRFANFLRNCGLLKKTIFD